MELNLLPILNCDGKSLPIDFSVELPDCLEDNFSFISTVTLSGKITNIGGSLELNVLGKTAVELSCDRCNETFVTDIDFEINEVYKKESADGKSDEDNPDVVILSGNVIDIDELAYSGVYLNLPTKALCSEDCKGLCSNCGKNLNNGSCSCDDRPTDPRFDILDKLL